MKPRLTPFYALLLAAIVLRYYAGGFVSSLFFLGTLLAYYRSENEAFWLAFYLVLVDGVFGFFGNFEAVVSIIPGLPEIEITQLYILLSIVKAARKPPSPYVFYHPFLAVFLIYLLFLIAQGHALGVSMQLNIQFRIVKYLMPLMLFFSIPRLFDSKEKYWALFAYLFPVAILAFAAQVFTIVTWRSPGDILGVMDDGETGLATGEQVYRGLYNPYILLISFLGALLALAMRAKMFRPEYAYTVAAVIFFAVFLSATRGWILSFSFIFLMFLLFVVRLSVRRLSGIIVGAALVLATLNFVPVLNVQMNNAFKRFLTLESLVEGDLTADGTLLRLTERGPRILKRWRESPITGWGFSNEFFEYRDPHVGNQNILFHSGIVGAFLIALFFLYFLGKLLVKALSLPAGNPSKDALLLLIIFFISWFILHSTSVQFFGFHVEPGNGVIQAIFFSLAAFLYHNAEISDLEAPEEAFPELATHDAIAQR
jgi:hypothetical protein